MPADFQATICQDNLDTSIESPSSNNYLFRLSNELYGRFFYIWAKIFVVSYITSNIFPHLHDLSRMKSQSPTSPTPSDPPTNNSGGYMHVIAYKMKPQ